MNNEGTIHVETDDNGHVRVRAGEAVVVVKLVLWRNQPVGNTGSLVMTIAVPGKRYGYGSAIGVRAKAGTMARAYAGSTAAAALASQSRPDSKSKTNSLPGLSRYVSGSR